MNELLEIAENMTNNDAWVIRKRANQFLRDWFFRARLEGFHVESIPK